MTTRLLVVDDEDSFRKTFVELLEAEGFEVRGEPDETRARRTAEAFAPDVAVLDWVLASGRQGPALARALRAGRPELGVVFVTGYNAAELADEAEALAAPVLQKPFGLRDLQEAVQAVLPDAD